MATRSRFAAVLGAFVVAVAVASPALSHNYGGKSRAYQHKIERMVRLWFKGGATRAICVIRKESGYNPRAVNYAGPVAGLFQIRYPTWTPTNPGIWIDSRSTVRSVRLRARSVIRFWHGEHVTWDQFYRRLSNPVQSIRLAHILYRHSGMGPWSYDGC